MRNSQTFECRLEALPEIRAFILRQLSGIEEITSNQIVLAADEIFTNAIRHGVCQGKRSGFSLTVVSEPGEVLLEIFDNSRAFPVHEKVEVDCLKKIQNRERGGLGLFLVQHIMDEITVLPMGDSHIIRLKKNI